MCFQLCLEGDLGHSPTKNCMNHVCILSGLPPAAYESKIRHILRWKLGDVHACIHVCAVSTTGVQLAADFRALIELLEE